MKKCRKCGRLIGEDDLYCKYCGRKQKGFQFTFWRSLLIAFLIFMTAPSLIYSMLSDSDKQEINDLVNSSTVTTGTYSDLSSYASTSSSASEIVSNINNFETNLTSLVASYTDNTISKEYAKAVADLLLFPQRAHEMGQAAHESVRREFLPDRHLLEWLETFVTALG